MGKRMFKDMFDDKLHCMCVYLAFEKKNTTTL